MSRKRDAPPARGDPNPVSSNVYGGSPSARGSVRVTTESSAELRYSSAKMTQAATDAASTEKSAAARTTTGNVVHGLATAALAGAVSDPYSAVSQANEPFTPTAAVPTRLSSSPAPQAMASACTTVSGRWTARAASCRARICARHHTMADEGGGASRRALDASAAIASAMMTSICSSVSCGVTAQPRWSADAILRRARKSSGLMLPVLRPSTFAISACGDPFAYASQSNARSRGFRRPSARRTSCRASRSPFRQPPRQRISTPERTTAAPRWLSRKRFVAIRKR